MKIMNYWRTMAKYWVILSMPMSKRESRQFKQRCLNDVLFRGLKTKFKIIPASHDNKFHVIRSVSQKEYNTPKGTVPLRHEAWQTCVRYYTRVIKELEKK